MESRGDEGIFFKLDHHNTFQNPPAVAEASFQLPKLNSARGAHEIHDTNKWLHRSGLASTRSVFVFQIQTTNFTGYLFEVQRAAREVKNEAGEKESKEANYCGLVAIPQNDCDLQKWLGLIFEVISWKRGIMKEVSSNIKDITFHQNYYPRSKRDSKSLEGQATAFLTLERLGIKI